MKIVAFIVNQLSSRNIRTSFYYKSFVIVLMLTCIPIALIGTSIYVVGTRYIENEITQAHQTQLSLISERIADYLSSVELTASQWASSPVFTEQVRNIDLLKDHIKIHNLYRTLYIIKASNPLVDQVYVYLDNPQCLISPERMILEDQSSILNSTSNRLETYGQLLKKDIPFYWIDTFRDGEDDQAVSPLSYVRKLTYGNGEAFGFIVFHLDAIKLNKMLRELTNDKQGTSFFLTERGEWIQSRNNNSVLSPLNLSLREEVLSRMNNKENSFVYNLSGEQYSTYFNRVRLVGLTWMYVTATPLSQVTRPVKFLAQIILIISGIGLILAIMLSWLSSNRIYRPIQRLIRVFSGNKPISEITRERNELDYIEQQWKYLSRESQYLQSRLEEAIPSLREGFLLKFFHGHFYALSEEELSRRMEQFGWVTKNKCFAVLLFQIFGLSNPQSKFTQGDEQLVTFAAANIIEEYSMNKVEQIGTVNFHDMTVGLLISYPGEKSKNVIKEGLYQISKDLLDLISSLLKINITVSIGRLTEKVKDIPAIQQENQQILRYRDIQAGNQVLDVDELLPQSRDSVFYPFGAEKETIQAVRMGAQEEACRLVGQFVQEMVANTGTELQVQQGILQLLGSTLHAILEAGMNPCRLYSGVNLYEQLINIREPEEMEKWFQMNVLVPYFTELAKTQNTHMKQAVEAALNIIDREFMNDMFSLESCADELGIKPYTLSKAFKQITGKNFIDYLTEYRLEKAKEFLTTSDLKVNDIAQKVGYQVSYMFRVFKKYEGMTPGEYREKNIGSL